MPKRVVVVDDSRSIRSWLCHVIRSDPRLEVVGEACDAFEARDIIKQTNPDVLTLDIEMPGMSGLEFLKRLIRLRPMPVVMVSSLTQRGSEAAIKALSIGAVDCIVKPTTMTDPAGERAITRRLFAAACSRVNTPREQKELPKTRMSHAPILSGPQIILIGASTGGVAALQTLIGGLDPNGPPVVIVQHMPGPFLLSFSERLNALFPQDIGLLERGVPVLHGQVRLAPEMGQHSAFGNDPRVWNPVCIDRDPEDLHCPSVDMLFHSCVRRAAHVTAAILTGLGRDGAQGMKALHDAGAHTIGQDQASCAVYGMPRAAAELGAIDEHLPLDDIAGAINRATARKALNLGACI